MNVSHLPSGKVNSKHVLIASFIAFSILPQLLFLPLVSQCGTKTAAQGQQAEPLGSLTKLGEVFINESPAPSEATIFPGDTVRTGEHGVASFTASGKGTLKFSPNSSAVFSGGGQYIAELKSGTAVVSSVSGPGGLTLRVRDFFLVPAVQEQQTTARVDMAPDGSASITCLEGSLSVISSQGAAGVLLQSSQSVAISAAGELPSTAAPSAPQPSEAPTGTATTPTPPQQQKSKKGWIILGAAGGGAALIIAAAAASGGGHHPVSPASP